MVLQYTELCIVRTYTRMRSYCRYYQRQSQIRATHAEIKLLTKDADIYKCSSIESTCSLVCSNKSRKGTNFLPRGKTRISIFSYLIFSVVKCNLNNCVLILKWTLLLCIVKLAIYWMWNDFPSCLIQHLGHFQSLSSIDLAEQGAHYIHHTATLLYELLENLERKMDHIFRCTKNNFTARSSMKPFLKLGEAR